MTRPIPTARRVAPAASDDSPAYGNGRGNELGDAFAGLIDSHEAAERAIGEASSAYDAEARRLWRTGDREGAAKLFEAIAKSYRAAGFKVKASSYESSAREARTPPKTIGKKSKRGAR